jgi:hypothetical protein
MEDPSGCYYRIFNEAREGLLTHIDSSISNHRAYSHEATPVRRRLRNTRAAYSDITNLCADIFKRKLGSGFFFASVLLGKCKTTPPGCRLGYRLGARVFRDF